MAMAMFKIRILANACITRYERGERTMNDIIDSYVITAEDRELVVAEIVSKKPDLVFDAE
ncbi:hypothetical protein [Exiguobacterium sp. s163]|uniref:hypothetical protein n=1 Tax=Exiguobacterium sp. s163 TaxID=2751287 RepID=UPI001BE93ACD|nr:hypothetical protein [Exiguobacterium sp. s163]